jgi:ubiquinone/menaquinone biosynthesis C-methylase UbiE
MPGVIASDYVFCNWCDLTIDAHTLPFKRNSLGNIICVDVLHHLDRPVLFLQEAERVLQKGGRVVMLEPYVSVFSRVVYKYFHQEDLNFSIDVWNDSAAGGKKQAL